MGEITAEMVTKLVVVLYRNGTIDSEDVELVFSHMEDSEEIVEDIIDEEGGN